jgi:hypothetical protein
MSVVGRTETLAAENAAALQMLHRNSLLPTLSGHDQPAQRDGQDFFTYWNRRAVRYNRSRHEGVIHTICPRGSASDYTGPLMDAIKAVPTLLLWHQ